MSSSQAHRLSLLPFFGQDVSHRLPILIPNNERELGPGEAMMKTARHPAVLGQAEEFAVLHGPQAHRLSTVRGPSGA